MKNKKYTIYQMDGTPIMNKTSEQVKSWIAKYNITLRGGDKIDLRKIGLSTSVINVNGKLLKICAW